LYFKCFTNSFKQKILDLKRGIYKFILGKKYQGPEPGDRLGEELQHHYLSIREVENEVKKAGFKIIKYASHRELKENKKRIFSSYTDGLFYFVIKKS